MRRRNIETGCAKLKSHDVRTESSRLQDDGKVECLLVAPGYSRVLWYPPTSSVNLGSLNLVSVIPIKI